jgi:cyclic pyranopterin phosphate synthase
MLQDRHNRIISYLRISVTDRCNFRCVYCMPAEGVDLVPRDNLLTYEEIARVARVGSTLGLSKIRLTGGEPTVRHDLPDLVTQLRAIAGIEEITMTTNAARLDVMAQPLQVAGMDRLNISIDTLDSEKMKAISRRDLYGKVLSGIEAAAKYFPIKFNCVAMRGVNEDEFCDLVSFAHKYSAQMRFIEYMPMGQARFDTQDKFISAQEIREILSSRFDLQPETRDSKHETAADPARGWVCTKTGARVGFITSMSEHFCDTCNRMRLTAEGGLRPCLHQNAEVDVKQILRNGGSDDEIAQAFRAAANLKWAGHHMNDVIPLYSVKEMVTIGG